MKADINVSAKMSNEYIRNITFGPKKNFFGHTLKNKGKSMHKVKCHDKNCLKVFKFQSRTLMKTEVRNFLCSTRDSSLFIETNKQQNFLIIHV